MMMKAEAGKRRIIAAVAVAVSVVSGAKQEVASGGEQEVASGAEQEVASGAEQEATPKVVRSIKSIGLTTMMMGVEVFSCCCCVVRKDALIPQIAVSFIVVNVLLWFYFLPLSILV